jgi:hypothetical protein
MWRRALCSLAVVALGATTLPAQEFLWAGYARTVALGQTAEAFKDGYLLDVGVAWKVGSRDDLSLQTGLLYGGNHVQGVGGTVDLWGLTVGLGYSPITVGALKLVHERPRLREARRPDHHRLLLRIELASRPPSWPRQSRSARCTRSA